MDIWKSLGYCRYEPAVANDDIFEFTDANPISDSFKLKEKITDKWKENDTINAEIVVTLKHLSIFCGRLEIPPTHSELIAILIWYANYFISAGTVANINQK